MSKSVYIYSDEGVGDFSLNAVKNYFSSEVITLINAETITKNGIPVDVDLFVMPGGADRPYAKKLNGTGNKAIKKYVEQGGTYLGICAGGYYGCSEIEFQKGTSGEICEPRELGFFQGLGIGCLSELTNPYDQTLNSASVTTILGAKDSIKVLYWGGCFFKPHENSQFKILYQYEEVKDHPPAIISCEYGKGLAILSGVHFEASHKSLKSHDFDHSNDNSLKDQFIQKLESSNSINFDELLKQALTK
ncbi:MAG: BPL-N domain-containing protein [Pseudomonadota bacterium]